ncbi:immunoglobulin mu heavy chain-like isoform X2 [Hyperolius riggenbachi]|uniref:immunoglobulin mu heavy chain-like isoform X2 n=1 Tax=Hyperolius riggenbachi TaxID=752182 RepID=UPI0035A28C7E
MDATVLFLVIFPLGVLSQTLQESGPGIVKPSQELKITCTVSGFELSSYGVSWIRQRPGETLEWIGVVWGGGSIDYANSLKSRTTISKDNAKKELYLQMRAMEPIDSGTYYCAKLDVWGPGTTVTVTAVPVSAPSVFPLIPCCKNVNPEEDVKMGCLVTGAMPGNVDMEWDAGNTTSRVITTGPLLNSEDGLYMLSSQLTIPASEWKNESYHCSVAHPYTSTRQNVTLTVLPCIKPDVRLFLQSPCSDGESEEWENSNSIMDLVCMVSEFYPEIFRVQWLVNGKEDVSAQSSVSVPLRTKDGTFTANSRLPVLKGQWNRGNQYSCSVIHPASDTNTTAKITKCQESCSAGPVIVVTPPSFEECYIIGKPKISCLVHSMKTIENFKVIWTREKEGDLDVNTEDPVLSDNGTYSAVSTLSICCDDWMSGERFTCTVKNQDFPSPVSNVIFKSNAGMPRAPSVHVFPPPQEEIAKGETVSLTCMATGFQPSDIFIKWLHGNKEIRKEKYVNTTPMKKDDNTYIVYSYLSVFADSWKNGDSFTCVVGHEALPLYTSQRTIDKSSGKPTNVSVSLVMSETSSTCF